MQINTYVIMRTQVGLQYNYINENHRLHSNNVLNPIILSEHYLITYTLAMRYIFHNIIKNIESYGILIYTCSIAR